MIKKKNTETRFYLFSNIIFLLGIFGIMFVSLKISYKETSTGIYFKKISNGTGKSIKNFIEEVSKETKDEKNNDVNKKEKHPLKKPKVFLRVERSIFFKGEIIEYPGSSFNNLLLLDYESVKKNNYCCDLIECVNFLKNIGDKYIFKIKAKDLGLEGVKKIRPDDYVCVELELVELFTSDNMLAKYFGLYSEFIQKTNNRIKQEKELITRYLNNIGRDYKNAGDYYLVIDDNGRGQYIKNGDKVKFNYSIKEHGGNIIDTNIKYIAIANDIFSNKNEYKPIEIEIKLKSSSPLQCLKFLKKGGQGKIYYPFSISGELGKISFYEMDLEVLSVQEGNVADDKKVSKDSLEQNKNEKSSENNNSENNYIEKSTDLDSNDEEDEDKNYSENNSSSEYREDKSNNLNDDVIDNKVDTDEKNTIVNENVQQEKLNENVSQNNLEEEDNSKLNKESKKIKENLKDKTNINVNTKEENKEYIDENAKKVDNVKYEDEKTLKKQIEEEKLKIAKIENENKEREKLEKIKKEKEKLERERQKKIERERIIKEKEEKKQREKIKIAREKEEKERLAKEKKELERIRKERLAKEKEENEKLEKERIEEEKRIEKERKAREKEEQKMLEKERKIKEKEEKKRLEKEKKEKER